MIRLTIACALSGLFAASVSSLGADQRIVKEFHGVVPGRTSQVELRNHPKLGQPTEILESWRLQNTTRWQYTLSPWKQVAVVVQNGLVLTVDLVPPAAYEDPKKLVAALKLGSLEPRASLPTGADFVQPPPPEWNVFHSTNAWVVLLLEREGGRQRVRIMRFYHPGTTRPPVFDAEALARLRQAAAQDDPVAQHQLGWTYEAGNGVERDYGEAVRWYRKSAELGYAPAQHSLGGMYLSDRGVTGSLSEGLRWFHKAADQDHAHSLLTLALTYEQGRGVEKNLALAAKLYGRIQRAAERGDPLAQRALGKMYLSGCGVERDHTKTIYWFRRASNRNASADAELAWMKKAGLLEAEISVETKGSARGRDKTARPSSSKNAAVDK